MSLTDLVIALGVLIAGLLFVVMVFAILIVVL